MKIGLVCRHFQAARGGLERYTTGLAEALSRQGHEVHVFANTGKAARPLRLHRVPLFPLSSPGKNLSFALMAAKRTAGHNLDVVQSMERIWTQDIFRASDGINPVQMLERYPHPLVRRLKAAGPRRQALTLLEKRIFERGGARFIMTNSNLVKDQICRFYRISPERIVVIYNSVDHQRFNLAVRERFREKLRRHHGVGDPDLLLLFAGNDFQRKGLDILLEAMARVPSAKIRLLVAGSDPIAAYRRRAVQNGLGDRVLFLGHMEALESLYAAADLLVLPTRYDAFSNVCLEAMACGTPVITTRTNGASEIVGNGQNGWLLSTWKAEELAARIRDFMALSDRSPMGQRAVEAAGPFTSERYMERLFHLYEAVLEAKRR
jgi:UDP-glucose:(heptosyl)LPS alpha-1,3-glucosyltransferase